MICLTLIDTPDEQDLFGVLYEKYKRLMFQVAMGVLSDSYLAEDAVHEAFLKIATHPGLISDADSKRTMRLMVTIAKHAAIDIYRKRARAGAHEVAVDDFDEVGGAVVFPEEEEELPRLITELPPRYRDVFLLKYASEYDNHEISRILKIPENTIRQRLSRGKAMIEKRLQKKGNDEEG